MSEAPDEHKHYSQRAGWLRASLLGAMDGVTSLAGLMMTFGSANTSRHTLLLAGLSGLVSGALSMAIGELLSVWTTRDSEQADIRQEIAMQNAGESARLHELEELTEIYIKRGMSPSTAESAAREMSEKDVIGTHARDELGIDPDNLTNPYLAAVSSALSFAVGGSIPLLSGIFIGSYVPRIISIAAASLFGMTIAGVVAAVLSGASVFVGAFRVAFGGSLVLAATWGLGQAFK